MINIHAKYLRGGAPPPGGPTHEKINYLNSISQSNKHFVMSFAHQVELSTTSQLLRSPSDNSRVNHIHN